MLLTRTGRIAKTHTSLRSALAEALRDATQTNRTLLTFLARAYKYEELRDYGLRDAAVITADEASALIESAAAFLERVDMLIADAESGGSASHTRSTSA